MLSIRKKSFYIFIVIVILLFFVSTDYSQNSFVYVSLRGSDEIAIFKLNVSSGSLKLIENEYIPGGPACITLDPTKNYMYVAQRSSNSISAYNINPHTGHLNYLNTIKAVDNPVFIATDRTCNFLLSTYYNVGKAAIYQISSGGKLKGDAVQILGGYVNPHCIQTDPSNQFLFLSDKGGNKIYQYKFNVRTGKINSNDPKEILLAPGMGPRHFTFFNRKNIVYFVNEVGNSITVYRLNTSTGLLSEFQNISTLPKDFRDSSKAAEIHLTPDDRFLYVSNRGYDSIAAFSVERKSGRLKANDYYPTVRNPRAFNIDPSGKFLFAAGENSDSLAIYHINMKSGELKPLKIIYVGKTPSWVLPVEFNYK